MRCQNAESKKPAICGALKLTKKLRQWRSRQLRRHLTSGLKVLRLDCVKNEASSSSYRPPSFNAQSSDRTCLQPGLLGSHLIPLILDYAVSRLPTTRAWAFTYRHGMHPVCIFVRGISSTSSSSVSAAMVTDVPLEEKAVGTPKSGVTLNSSNDVLLDHAPGSTSSWTGVAARSSQVRFRLLPLLDVDGGVVRHSRSTPVYQLLSDSLLSRISGPIMPSLLEMQIEAIFHDTLSQQRPSRLDQD